MDQLTEQQQSTIDYIINLENTQELSKYSIDIVRDITNLYFLIKYRTFNNFRDFDVYEGEEDGTYTLDKYKNLKHIEKIGVFNVRRDIELFINFDKFNFASLSIKYYVDRKYNDIFDFRMSTTIYLNYDSDVENSKVFRLDVTNFIESAIYQTSRRLHFSLEEFKNFLTALTSKSI